MKGSVFDRVKKPSAAAAAAAAAAVAAAAAQGPAAEVGASDLGSATFHMKRADDGTAPIGSMEVVDDVTGEVQHRVPQVRISPSGFCIVVVIRFQGGCCACNWGLAAE
jgi:hypothetical protein